MKKLKKLEKNLRNVLKISLISILLVSCSSVKIKDHEFCGDAGPLGASCFHTLTDESRDIEKEQWDQERFGMICTNAASFADWKESLLKLCKLAGKRCRYVVEKKIIEFNDKVESFTLSLENM